MQSICSVTLPIRLIKFKFVWLKPTQILHFLDRGVPVSITDTVIHKKDDRSTVVVAVDSVLPSGNYSDAVGWPLWAWPSWSPRHPRFLACPAPPAARLPARELPTSARSWKRPRLRWARTALPTGPPLCSRLSVPQPGSISDPPPSAADPAAAGRPRPRAPGCRFAFGAADS
jgi:hypothetical protein